MTFHIEHIRAKQHHGGDDPSNLALACPECNLRKGPNLTAIDFASGEIVPLFNPRIHLWNEHFFWDEWEIQGRTGIGRGTAELLRFNTPDRLRMRQLLTGIGHDPRE